MYATRLSRKNNEGTFEQLSKRGQIPENWCTSLLLPCRKRCQLTACLPFSQVHFCAARCKLTPFPAIQVLLDEKIALKNNIIALLLRSVVAAPALASMPRSRFSETGARHTNG